MRPARGGTEEEKEAVDRLRARCLELAMEVSGHPFWGQVETEKAAMTRSELKQVTRAAALDIAEAA
ncbi:hypothetical protein ACFT5C_21355 [Streptomyces sp. NPDC057116]|uniref:hypothetical protein n=1 Tax=Streptomyces sp. NPDC057116 TaxID=3346023 RepID=UPI003627AEC9